MKKRLIILAAVITAIAAFLFWSNNSITVSRLSVSPENLPDGFDGCKIVQVSDLHNKSFGGRLVKKIKEIAPDYIVITGDIIDSYHTVTQVSVDFISDILSVAPIYYVAGNHESRIEEYADFKEKIESLGVNVLENEAVILEKNGGEICLTGMNDVGFFGSSMLNENEIAFSKKLNELQAAADGKTSILLSHRPELFDTYAAAGYDLVFSGHAHGGQIRLPFVGGILSPGQGFFPEYTEGIYENGETKMIVSRGLGNSLFPFRIFNRPELIVCELEK